MKIAEQVTFGGSGCDRAADLRGQADLLDASRDVGQTILMWRGKPLLTGDKKDELVRLPLTHPALGERAVLLGRESGEPIFAHDISDWDPVGQDLSDVGSFYDRSMQTHPLIPGDVALCDLKTRMAALSARDAELAATAKSILAWQDSHRFCAKCGDESEKAQWGWQRDCPACGASHFPRTDPVVIMLVTHGNRVLMGRSPGWPDGMYSLLAGFVEPGETIEAAVRRETWEEAGVRVGPVRYLTAQPWPWPSSLMFGCAGEALDDNITIDPKEIEDAIWVSREEMLAVFAGENPNLLPARKGSVAQFILRNWLADRLD